MSHETANQIRLTLEHGKGLVYGMLGMTDSASLTQCPYETTSLNRISEREEFCPRPYIEVGISSDTEARLRSLLSTRNSSFVGQKILSDLKDDHAILNVLLSSARLEERVET